MKTLLPLAVLALLLALCCAAYPTAAASPVSPLYPDLPPRPLPPRPPPNRVAPSPGTAPVYVGLWWRGPDVACALWQVGDGYRLECDQ